MSAPRHTSPIIAGLGSACAVVAAAWIAHATSEVLHWDLGEWHLELDADELL